MAILVILSLVVLNGLLAMAELAVVSSRKARLHRMVNRGSTRAQAALELHENPDRFLATIQIGITLIGILAGAIGYRGLAGPLSAYIARSPALAPYAESIAFGIVIVVITYVSLILGELAPKRLALFNPEIIAAAVARPMQMLARIGRPAVWFLSRSTQLVLHLFRIGPSDEPPVTEEEIKVMLEQGAEAGVFEEAQHDIVTSLFKLGDKTVGAIMKPRRDVVWIDIGDSGADKERKIASSLFSRIPIANGTLDNVVGVVYTKDLLTRCMAGQPLQLEAAARPPLFVPERLPALKLLELFKKSRTHMAMVVDEYGGVEGLVTLTDVMENIVGDVALGDMPVENPVVQRPDGSWLVDGRYPVNDLKELLAITRLPEDDSGSYHTLGGFAMLQIGRVPVTGDRFESSGFVFEVVDMDGKRVDKVLISALPRAAESEEAED